MTATQALPTQTGRRYRFSILRILICGIFLSVLVAACLYCKYTAIDFFHARLLEQESKTSAWIIKQVSFALPWIVICLFHGLVYTKHDRRDGIAQREMFWEVLMVTAFVYLLLLPYLKNVSEDMYAAALEMGADIPQTDGKVDKTFLMIFHEWFIRMAVPLGVLLVFHSTRARREELHPETETEEPMMTKAEYDALRANEVDTDASHDIAEVTANDDALDAQAKCPCRTAEGNEGTEVADHE
jgi:hypothetical protein